MLVESDNITIEANYIGTDVSGLTATNPNSGDGIELSGADGTIIGNNLISGNDGSTGNGIQIDNSNYSLI